MNGATVILILYKCVSVDERLTVYFPIIKKEGRKREREERI